MFVDLTIKIKNKDFSYNSIKQTRTKMIIGIQQNESRGKHIVIWLFNHLKLSCKTLAATHQEVLTQLLVGKVSNNLEY